MRFAILVVFVLQMEWALPCTFQREDVMLGEHLSLDATLETECFAKCLNQQKCTGLCYEQAGYSCYLFADGDKEYRFSGCYSLHRDSVKPPQYTRKLSFIKKKLGWVVRNAS